MDPRVKEYLLLFLVLPLVVYVLVLIMAFSDDWGEHHPIGCRELMTNQPCRD